MVMTFDAASWWLQGGTPNKARVAQLQTLVRSCGDLRQPMHLRQQLLEAGKLDHEVGEMMVQMLQVSEWVLTACTSAQPSSRLTVASCMRQISMSVHMLKALSTTCCCGCGMSRDRVLCMRGRHVAMTNTSQHHIIMHIHRPIRWCKSMAPVDIWPAVLLPLGLTQVTCMLAPRQHEAATSWLPRIVLQLPVRLVYWLTCCRHMYCVDGGGWQQRWQYTVTRAPPASKAVPMLDTTQQRCAPLAPI